jgi:hypothetical protein
MKVIIKTRVVCTKVDIHLFYIVVIDTRMCLGIFLYPRSIGGRHTVLPLSVLPFKIFFVAFFSATIDDRNIKFGHKLHIGMPYCGKRFRTCQIPTSCLPT